MKLQNPTNTEAQDTSNVLGCEQVLFMPLFFHHNITLLMTYMEIEDAVLIPQALL